MAKRPKLRMTNADYVAIAISPALIMAMVGSLVFFLIEVLYVGQYNARLNYVFALFVFATVLIGRISIEMGADRAAMFALPLGIAMFLVLAKFVQHSSPYSHLINIALLGVVWWSTHKLTWDCTLIDDSEDASGEGLMQRIGADELIAEDTSKSENELLPDPQTKQTKTPHTPGLWVLYFSLAALPLFGLGQKWIPSNEVGRRQYAFGLLAVYVASGLALLVTTSFLGLRRYLRQKHVEMPTPMAATWVVTGGVLIAIVMLLAALLPRPQAEYAISQVPWQVGSPSDPKSSQTSFGSDGTEDENADSRQVINEETDPNATATREGDNPTAASEQGDKQSSAPEQTNDPESSETIQDAAPYAKSESGEQAGDSEAGDAAKPPAAEPDASQQSETTEQSNDAAEATDESETSESAASGDENTQQADERDSDARTNSFRPPPALQNLLPELGGLTGMLKLALYTVIALGLGLLAWRNRRQILQALREIVQQIRDLLARLFGGKRAEPVDGTDNESEKTKGPPPRPFSSYANPFASGQHQSMPPDELVRFTFEAFEAWARERGCPRSPDQTPLELIRQAVPKQSQLLAEAQQLARLYNEAAYAPGSVSPSAVASLSQLWTLLGKSTAQTPLEPIS